MENAFTTPECSLGGPWGTADGSGVVAGSSDLRCKHHRAALGTGLLGLLGNVVWFLVAGWWLALGHLSSALACFVTIIGIPFGIQHIKLALIAFTPVGMTVIHKR